MNAIKLWKHTAISSTCVGAAKGAYESIRKETGFNSILFEGSAGMLFGGMIGAGVGIASPILIPFTVFVVTPVYLYKNSDKIKKAIYPKFSN